MSILEKRWNGKNLEIFKILIIKKRIWKKLKNKEVKFKKQNLVVTFNKIWQKFWIWKFLIITWQLQIGFWNFEVDNVETNWKLKMDLKFGKKVDFENKQKIFYSEKNLKNFIKNLIFWKKIKLLEKDLNLVNEKTLKSRNIPIQDFAKIRNEFFLSWECWKNSNMVLKSTVFEIFECLNLYFSLLSSTHFYPSSNFLVKFLKKLINKFN